MISHIKNPLTYLQPNVQIVHTICIVNNLKLPYISLS
jgi:hypothetical protein